MNTLHVVLSGSFHLRVSRILVPLRCSMRIKKMGLVQGFPLIVIGRLNSHEPWYSGAKQPVWPFSDSRW